MWRVPSKRLAQQPEVGSKRARAVPPANIAAGRGETARQVLFACQRHLLKRRQESVGGSSHPCSETTRGTQLPMGGVSMRLAPNVLPAVFFNKKTDIFCIMCDMLLYMCPCWIFSCVQAFLHGAGVCPILRVCACHLNILPVVSAFFTTPSAAICFPGTLGIIDFLLPTASSPQAAAGPNCFFSDDSADSSPLFPHTGATLSPDPGVAGRGAREDGGQPVRPLLAVRPLCLPQGHSPPRPPPPRPPPTTGPLPVFPGGPPACQRPRLPWPGLPATRGPRREVWVGLRGEARRSGAAFVSFLGEAHGEVPRGRRPATGSSPRQERPVFGTACCWPIPAISESNCQWWPPGLRRRHPKSFRASFCCRGSTQNSCQHTTAHTGARLRMRQPSTWPSPAGRQGHCQLARVCHDQSR